MGFSRIFRNRIVQACICLVIVAGCAAGPGSSGRSNSPLSGKHKNYGEVPPQALTLFEKAVAIMAAGNTAKAQPRFEEFIQQYPDYPGAYVNLAIIHASNSDDEAVESYLTDALAIDPGHPIALNQLGMLRRRQGKFAEAEAAYLKAIKASRKYALAHYNLAVLNELYLQRMDVALKHFERYQSYSGEDKQVAKWIVDLRRRVQANRRAANVTE